MPPEHGKNRTHGVGNDICEIAGRVRQEFGADPLEQRRPENEVTESFDEARSVVVRAQAKLAMQPKNWRQRAGDQPEVIELRMEKSGVEMGFDQPAIERVGNATEEKKRITHVIESSHVRED